MNLLLALLLSQPVKSTDVTPSDSTDLTGLATKGIYVGTGGDVAYQFTGDTAAHTLKNVASGTLLPGNYKRVMSTNTTASNIVAWA